MVKIVKMDAITTEIMLRKGLNFRLYLGKQQKRDKVWSVTEGKFWEPNIKNKFEEGILIISAKCCREVQETKY